jgi:hypothetical protein
MNKPKLSRPAIEKIIDDWVFSQRDREIVKARLLDGMYYEEMEVKFHLCERQLKRIVYKYQNIIYQIAEKN